MLLLFADLLMCRFRIVAGIRCQGQYPPLSAVDF